RYRTNNSNQKPLERTQNWIKLGGKVTATDQIGFNRSYRPGSRGHAYGLVVACQGVYLLIYVTQK
ncbi:hypothetical protein ACC694_37120, partial [Rhizobium ruizarguesonis]